VKEDGVKRLVVVSNRLPRLNARTPGAALQTSAGGLASALMGALRTAGRSLWFGWNGRVVEAGRENRLTRVSVEGIDLAGMPLTQSEVNDYYLGYCNELLWPLFHCFQGKVRMRPRHLARAKQVQERFAAALRPLLRSGDMVWVHDYHFLELGRELRRLDWSGPVGFFLHIPFPPYDLCQVLPDPRDLLEAMVEYDVIGFHVDLFRDNYVYSCRRELEAVWDGRNLRYGPRTQRVIVCPVGIDPEDFLPGAAPEAGGEAGLGFTKALRGRRLILGVDRLDYTKGVTQRILAFERFVRENPEWRRKVVYVQVASPSREGIEEYADQRRRVESLIGRVNGELGEHDWVPIWYLYRSYSRGVLAQLYRAADVGLVTPLRDGMNLVAKEFVAAQTPESPGVLVLSRTAGAAQEMREAVAVNSYDPADVSKAIRTALMMPLEERRERHAALLAKVLCGTAEAWSRAFVQELEAVGTRKEEGARKTRRASRH
jgi:trehalose 6-phosphate synthase